MSKWLVLLAFVAIIISPATSRAQSIAIGEAAVLTNGDNGNGGLVLAQSAVLSQPATIQSLSFYVTHAAGKLLLGIYDATGPNGEPGKLLAQTASFTPTTGWNTQPVTAQVLLSAATYWLAYLPSSNNLQFVKQNNSGPCYYHSHSSTSMPAVFSTSPNNCGPTTWSFYATAYATAAAGSSPPETISSVNLSNSTFTGGAPSGTVVGAISILMSPASPAFSGALSLAGANASSFQIVGTNLETNGIVPAGTYNVSIVATESGVSNSPFTQAETITGSTTPPPTLSLTIAPASPTISETSPLGTVVAVVSAAWSNGAPFTGTLSFTAPYNDDGGTFALSGNNLIINPLGLGVMGDGGTVQEVTVIATQ